MHNKQTLPLLLVATWLLLVPSWAGAAALTLDECIDWAITNNPQMKAYQSSIKEAEAGIGEAWGAFLPSLTLSYDQSQLFSSSGNGVDTDYIDQQSDRLTVRVSQPLFSGMSSVAGLNKARQNKEYRDRELQYARTQVKREVRISFYDVLMAQQLVAKRAEAVKRLEEQVRIAQAWVDQSLAPRVRLLEVQVVLSNARQELIAAKGSLANAMARLEEWLASGRDEQLEITGSLQQGVLDACSEVEACIDLAMQQRQELELMSLNIDMAKQDAKAIASRNLPRASLDASWTDYQRDYDNSSLPDDQRDYYTVMFNVSVQPFQGGRTIFAWKRQQASIERFQHLLIKQQNAIITEVRTRFEQLYETQAQLAAANDSVAQATEAYRLLTRSVELGVSSLRELLDSAVLLTRAEINQINSYHALQVARVYLDYVVGN